MFKRFFSPLKRIYELTECSSEDKFLCSVCLDVFSQPVSTPCGHNFCRTCIQTYWDSSDVCECPLCKRTFSSRPELHVNTIMAELAGEFVKNSKVKASCPDSQPSEREDVLCDICSDIQQKAVKSCLVCLTSFCKDHLEPHHRVLGLKSHKLIDAVSNLDDKMCKKHNKIMELYCRTDQTCVCVLCLGTDHNWHNVVAMEEEYEAVIVKKDEVMANLQKMIQTRCDKIDEIEKSLDASQKKADTEADANMQVFTDLIQSIQRSLDELLAVIEERHQATKQKAEGFLKELRTEVTELKTRSNQLELLSQSEDHQRFLQNFSTLCDLQYRDWRNVHIHADLSFQAVRVTAARLKQKAGVIVEQIPEIKLKRLREHTVDLTLDPDTAHYSLVISPDGKQVTTATERKLPKNPKRFEAYPEVLAKEGFRRRKFYFEVEVKGKTDWAVGVVRESVDRKADTDLSVSDGYWAIRLDDGKYFAHENSPIELKLKTKLKKVGVFVDYDNGEVSFLDVDTKSHIYSFFGHHFREKLFPYLCPQDNQNRRNSAPMIICTPVPKTQ